jgi:hypothetical protein
MATEQEKLAQLLMTRNKTPQLDLSISGGGGSLGAGAGGRLGLNMPLGNGNLNVGVLGQGSYDPYNGVNVKPTGIDAQYQTGNNMLRATYEQLSPQEKSLMLNYMKTF